MEANSETNKKRKGISLETKIKVLDYLEQGAGPTNVGEACTQWIYSADNKKNENAIRKSVVSGKNVNAKKTSYSRNVFIEEIENLLTIWIEDLIS